MVVGYISVLLLIVLVSVKGYAQAGKIEWGQEFEDNASVKPVFLKQDADGVSYWLTPRNGRLFITAFNNDYVKIQTWPLWLPYYKGIDVNKLYYTRSIVVKNKLLFLMNYIDAGSGQVEQLIVQGNIDDGQAGANLIHVARFSLHNTNGGLIDDIVLTPDASRLVVNTFIPAQGNEAARYIANVYNAATMQKILSKDYQLPKGYYISPAKNYMTMDKDNNIFVLANKPATNAAAKGFTCAVIKLSGGSDLTEEFPLDDLNNKSISDIGLTGSKQGAVTVSGFYQDNNSNISNNCYSGVFFAAINAGQPVHLQTTAFTGEEKLNSATPDLLYKNVNYVAKNNGGVILLSEQQFKDHGKLRYGNVFVVDLNNDGTVNYAKTLLKNQLLAHKLKGQSYYSYYSHYVDARGDLLLFYNDNPKNVEQNTGDNQTTPDNAVPVLAMVNNEGTVTTSLIKTAKPELLCPLSTAKISDDEFIIWGKKNGAYRLGWLTLNEKTRAIKQLGKHTAGPAHTPKLYGLRFRGNDGKEKYKAFTGLNMAAVSSHLSKSNGVSVGLLGNQDKVSNGLSYGTFFSVQDKVNGITISPCAAVDKKMNGVSIGGLFAGGGTVNGAAISGLAAGGDQTNGALIAPIAIGSVNGVGLGMGLLTDDIKGVGLSMFHLTTGPSDGLFATLYYFSKPLDAGQTFNSLKGVVVAGWWTNICDVRGVTIAPINYAGRDAGLAVGGINATKELHGVQLGFLNYAGNNPKALRLLPLINMHLRR